MDTSTAYTVDMAKAPYFRKHKRPADRVEGERVELSPYLLNEALTEVSSWMLGFPETRRLAKARY